MSKVVQEKFEVVEPVQAKEGSAWNLNDSASRDNHGLQTRSSGGRYEGYRGDQYNRLPPGMDIDDQEVFARSTVPQAGDYGTGSQATSDVNPTSMREGFDKKPLRPTDDMYTREHNDAFYDDVGGFVERNNYLDRM